MLPVLLTLLAAYAGLCLLMVLFQDRLVYFPGPPPSATPSAIGREYTDLELVTEDGVRLHGWYVPADDARGAVLVCHGNGGSIDLRLPAARAFLEMGLSVLLFDYRGYGASEGRPSEAGTYLDAEAAYDHLTGSLGVAQGRVALYGESLGGGVAVELATRRPVACVVTESTFTSLPDVGAVHYGWLPVRWLTRYRYDNASKVAELDVPLLVVHSPEDELVPFAQAERLVQRANGPTTLLRTAGGHNGGGFLQRAEWRARVETFLLDALR